MSFIKIKIQMLSIVNVINYTRLLFYFIHPLKSPQRQNDSKMKLYWQLS